MLYVYVCYGQVVFTSYAYKLKIDFFLNIFFGVIYLLLFIQ